MATTMFGSTEQASVCLGATLHSPKLTWKPIKPHFRGTVVFVGPLLGLHVSSQEFKVYFTHQCFYLSGLRLAHLA